MTGAAILAVGKNNTWSMTALVQDAPPKDHGGTAVSGAGPTDLQCGLVPGAQRPCPGAEMCMG